MKIQTSELTGLALDWAVARSLGAKNLRHDTVAAYWFTLDGKDRVLSSKWSENQSWHPSTNWAQGGPIIEWERLELFDCAFLGSLEQWKSCHTPDGAKDPHFYFVQYGPTPLIAAMRCYVASKLGDEIEIPEELI